MQDTYIFKEIPSQRPNTPLLDRIDEPAQLRELAPEQLTRLARELRAFLLWSVGQTGGHFGAGLGVLVPALGRAWLGRAVGRARLWK